MIKITRSNAQPIPFTNGEAADYCRTDEDQVATLMSIAVANIEAQTGYHITEKTLTILSDANEWKRSGGRLWLRIGQGVITSLTSIKTMSDPTETGTIYTSSEIESAGHYYAINGDYISFDVETFDEISDFIEVTCKVGEGAPPDEIKMAVYQMISHMDSMRTPVIAGTIVTEVPYTVKYLCDPYRFF